MRSNSTTAIANFCTVAAWTGKDKGALTTSWFRGHIAIALSPDLRMQGSVERSILDGFTYMLRSDVLHPAQIGNGPGHFQDPVIGPGRKAKPCDSVADLFFPCSIEPAELPDIL